MAYINKKSITLLIGGLVFTFLCLPAFIESLNKAYYQRSIGGTAYGIPLEPCSGGILNKSIKSLNIEKNIEGKSEVHGSIDGSFALGFGSVGGSIEGSGYTKNIMLYYYYGINPDGSYKLDSVPADKTTIYEDANETPYLEWVGMNDNRTATREVAFLPQQPSQDQIKKLNQTACVPASEYIAKIQNRTLKSGEYYLHIPAGSIKTEYNPNLR